MAATSKLAITLCLAALGCGPASAPDAPAEPPAELVLLGGDVRTMDESRPQVSALAVRGGRIVALGSDDEVRARIGEGTRVVELAGRTVTPGLVDAHAHLHGLGAALDSVDLRGSASAEEAAARVAAAADGQPDGAWITGRGWDQNLWPGQAFPHRRVLDAAVAGRPVAVRRVDGHALWASSAALARAGVTRDTPAPAGGKIVVDDAGEPTGVLVDAAMELVEGAIPPPSPELIERRIVRAAERAIEVGLTGVHEMGIGPGTEAVYRRVAAEGRLPLRVYAFLAGDLDAALALADRAPEIDADGTARFTVRAMKLFADGALGSRGAALLEPYSDDPGNQGLWITPAEDLARAAEAAAAAGWQLGVHAIGDAANRAVLDAYAAAYRGRDPDQLRFRVEHAQVLAPADLPRLAALGVIASMQPTHATSDMPWAEDRVGAERILTSYAWRDLLDSGAALALGSDFPVEEVPPLQGVFAAVSRQDRSGSPAEGWYPAQRLSLDEALRGFTVGAAYASFSETHRGVLRPGYVADLTVFDRPLAPDRSLLDTRVDFTIVGGEVVFERR